jgi:uncharacterized RDD family membrane protein YckC
MKPAAGNEGRSRLATAAGRLAFFPARVAARASRDQLEAAADDVLVPELARLIDGALASSLPEDVARSIVKHRVLERVIEELAASGELDRAVDEALKSPHTSELIDRVLHSDQMRRAISEVVAGPDVRAAMAKQTTGLAEELVVGVRKGAVRLDDRAEHAVRRRARAVRSPFAGIATRAVAGGIDASVIFVAFAAVAGLAGLIGSLVGGLRPEWLGELLLAGGAMLLAGGYFVLFWSGAGQTPGMRLLRVRVRGRGRDGGPLSFGRAVVRVLGTVIAIVPFFAGYLPVLFDERRRGLADFMAATEVVYDDSLGSPPEA